MKSVSSNVFDILCDLAVCPKGQGLVLSPQQRRSLSRCINEGLVYTVGAVGLIVHVISDRGRKEFAKMKSGLIKVK